MNYIELKVSGPGMTEDVEDVLAALLAPLGYDSFENGEECLKAYCPENLFSEEALAECLGDFPLPGVELKWSSQVVETQNWNQQWEEENAITPIPFGDGTITIHPCMSFGSGHHETTSQLLEEIQQLDLKGRKCLDMGTGTGVLAIGAALKGAQVRAIEIDDWVAENAKDNVLLNNMAAFVRVECGDAALLGNGETYDLVLANINRNVLLADMKNYVADMAQGATLLMSGFYEEDVPAIRTCAEALGLTYQYHRNRNNWVVIKFEK